MNHNGSAMRPRDHVCPPCAKSAPTIFVKIAGRSKMSMKRVSAELEEVPTEEFCAGTANVLFSLAAHHLRAWKWNEGRRVGIIG